MSRIFTKAELKEIERRKKGDKSDKYSLWHSRVRPKIIEILAMNLRELRRLLTPKKNGKR